MERRRLGRTDLDVSRLGLGCAKLGGTVTGSAGAGAGLLHAAFEEGINFFDTADSYGNGKSEELLGQAFRDRRDQVVIASKAGYRVSAAAGWALRIKPLLQPLIASASWLKRAVRQARTTQKPQDFSPEHLVQAVEGSLRRLQTDYLDLFQLHNPPLEELERGDLFDTIERLKEQGKIRYYGVSCRRIEDAVPAMRYPGVSAVQIPVNLMEQQAIDTILPQSRQKGIAVIARQPLASGFLARPVEEIKPDLTAMDRQQAEERLEVARRYQFLRNERRTLAEAALRFVLQQEDVAVTLVGTGNLRHLRANLEALEAPPLTEEEIVAVREAARPPTSA